MKKYLFALSFGLVACASNHRAPASEGHGTALTEGGEAKAEAKQDNTAQLARELDIMQRWKTLHDVLVGAMGEKAVTAEIAKLAKLKNSSPKKDEWTLLMEFYAKKLPRRKKEISSLLAAAKEFGKIDSGKSSIGDAYRAQATKKIAQLNPKSAAHARELLKTQIDKRIQEINKLPKLANMSQAQKLALFYEQVGGGVWFAEELFVAGVKSAHADQGDPAQQAALSAMYEDSHRLMFAISDKLETGFRDLEKTMNLLER